MPLSAFQRLFDFGLKKEAKISSKDAIERLQDVEDLLNKKVELLETKVEEEKQNAIKCSKASNKRGALNALKRKKRYEKTLLQLDGTLVTLETQREHLQNAATNVDVLKVMKNAAGALKKTNENLDVDTVHNLIDNLAEQNETAEEIARAISTPFTGNLEYIDDDELERELNALAGDEDQKDMINIGPLPNVPNTTLPAMGNQKALDDDLSLLEEWATDSKGGKNFVSRIFGGTAKGGQSKKANTPQEAIQQLRDVEDVLTKKVEFLEGKINEETERARRDARTNKRNALMALKRKKRLEKQLQQIDGTLTTLEYQREALQNASMNGQAFSALQGATNALKNVHKELNIDSVQDIMDDLAEQHGLSTEIANAISNPIGFGTEYDDRELEDELAALEQESLAKEMQQITLPSVPLHPIPVSSYQQPASKVRVEADLDELTRWAS
ncbi:unnamed protein product [Didymodactylos carnosus]|uniref:Charged multivesicular body protein 4b n=1 Tax=Didymodactylos carnosus TaxID=1234261 RepID=A0A814M2C3_9BILA|nr:unnamed protein product [Didymodactylos carnosus]CAF1071715.1 unnamed protein product [Didymodactylos carnosus]CAF3692037.1 unnamed protein product [Didymodactylos carnosus]CAF3838790.1 unnamed protein product [Didymodactylos carnosus]